MAIATQDFFGQFTKEVIEVYKEMPEVKMFLRSFFKEKVSSSKQLSIEVERGTEKYASDVIRTSSGNRNSFTKSNEKIFEPAYYKEWTDMTELEIYERAIGSNDQRVIADAISEMARRLQMMKNKIDRSIERQCSDVFNTGVVRFNSTTNIDFGRKGASLSDQSGTPWSNNANSPIASLQAGCDFLRNQGKMQGGTVNAIMSADVFNAMLSNTIFSGRADIRNYNLDALRAPQKNSVGGSLHGYVSVGSYNVLIWTYPEVYDESGVSTPYVPAKKYILLPETPNFTLGFAQVPLLMKNRDQAGQPYVVKTYEDDKKDAEIVEIRSAPLAIPTAIDQIYTAQVLA